ncbi:TadE/TadG family type IV pilus assembly protein [Tropicimonas marinistellae]|uniref:TadE/TadG family type IV pilus assembly protein n=1 Tax=Tropicimonas marinistellae TaxID=1739787 RepID=UPI00082CD939|nr:TadE family protein [Tropicimonas marinistellae]
MKRTDTSWFSSLRPRFAREDGNVTIEFVILFPIFMVLFMSAFEVGLLMVRQVMLDRAVDLTVRSLRLGQWDIPTGDSDEAKLAQLAVHDQMKTVICDAAGILPDCESNLFIELNKVSTVTWEPLSTAVTCADKNAEVSPPASFNSGLKNDLMMVRVCSKQKPIFPLSGLGAKLQYVDNEYYALVSMTAFVNEPS